MSQNRPTIRPALLLAGFVLMSILVHAIILATRFDKQVAPVNLMQISPPLQVVVMSSQGSKTDEPMQRPSKPSTRKSTVIKTESQPRTTVHTARHLEHAKPAASVRQVKKIMPVPATHEPLTTTKYRVDKTSVNQPNANKASRQERKAVPVNHLRAQLRSQLARHFTYPRLARRMGWEGQVGLGLHISKEGNLNKVRVIRSSGYKVLDENAQTTLNNIGRITVAANMYIKPVDTEIDVLYRLSD